MITGRLKRLKKKSLIFFKVWKKTIVLIYHRVDDVSIDPWNLSVSPQNFEGQLQVLKKTGLVVSMQDFSNNFFSEKALKPAIVITFDDGYLDNYVNAKPLLEKFNLPATFFITNKHLGENKEFWWDELAHMILETPQLPKEISLDIGENLFFYDLKEEAILNDQILHQNKAWYGENEPPTRRAYLYMQLWKLLSPLLYEEQQILMRKLRDCIGVKPHANVQNYCMSESQLISLASNDLFTLGGHTHSHPLLPAHRFELQLDEIGSNKRYLENLIKQKINSFAYPSGKSNQDTEKVLKNLGFDFAFNTIKRRIQKDDSPFQMGRVQINNLDKNEFRNKLGLWLI